MVRPALTYGALLWFRSGEIVQASKGMADKLRAIQGKCLRVVAGAYKATSVEALEAETHVEPLDIHASKVAIQAAARNKLSKAYTGIAARTKKALKGSHRRGPTPRMQGPFQKLTQWAEQMIEGPVQRAEGPPRRSLKGGQGHSPKSKGEGESLLRRKMAAEVVRGDDWSAQQKTPTRSR